jgi:hypothetical protein
MHDLSALEMDEHFGEFESDSEEEEEAEGYGEELELEESSELEAAAELLSVGNEQELDQFLGKLIGGIAKRVGKAIDGPLGNALGGTLKALARKALPMVATAIGGPLGGVVASGGLDTAMKAFGLELEGLSQEDQELELSRRFIRLANGTVRRALHQPRRHHQAPRQHVMPALRWAARRYAPSLLRGPGFVHRRHPRHHWGYAPQPAFSPYPAYPYAPEPAPSYADPGVPDAVPPGIDPAAAAAAAAAQGAACPTCGGPATAGAMPTEAAASGAESNEAEEEFYGGYGYARGGSGTRGYAGSGGGYGGSYSGRWMRRGNKIILFGA